MEKLWDKPMQCNIPEPEQVDYITSMFTANDKMSQVRGSKPLVAEKDEELVRRIATTHLEAQITNKSPTGREPSGFVNTSYMEEKAEDAQLEHVENALVKANEIVYDAFSRSLVSQNEVRVVYVTFEIEFNY